MGLKALANAVLSFKNVRVPRENLIGAEGQGLKIALVTLNTGRLALPAGTTGWPRSASRSAARGRRSACSGGSRSASTRRSRHKIARHGRERRSRWSRSPTSRRAWPIAAATTSASKRRPRRNGTRSPAGRSSTRPSRSRGGRGYETEQSLADARRDAVSGRAHDARLPHQPDLRGLVRDHASVHGARGGRQAPADRRRDDRPRQGVGAKLNALPKIGLFYAGWYPTRWIGWGRWPRYAGFGELAPHLRFTERATRKLAREIFHGMIVHKAKLQRAPGVSVPDWWTSPWRSSRWRPASRACARCARKATRTRQEAAQLADLFCRNAPAQDRPPVPRAVAQRRRPEIHGRPERAEGRARLVRGRDDGRAPDGRNTPPSTADSRGILCPEERDSPFTPNFLDQRFG